MLEKVLVKNYDFSDTDKIMIIYCPAPLMIWYLDCEVRLKL